MADSLSGRNGEASEREIEGSHFRRYGETFISADDSDTRPILTLEQLNRLLIVLAPDDDQPSPAGISESEDEPDKEGRDER